MVGGAVLTSDDGLDERLRFYQNAVGAVPSPFDCWLLLRGLKTLQLRVLRQCDNALAIARWLEGQDAVTQVYYPGLESNPGHALARRQMGGHYGGVVSFESRLATLRFPSLNGCASSRSPSHWVRSNRSPRARR